MLVVVARQHQGEEPSLTLEESGPSSKGPRPDRAGKSRLPTRLVVDHMSMAAEGSSHRTELREKLLASAMDFRKDDTYPCRPSESRKTRAHAELAVDRRDIPVIEVRGELG